MIVFSNSKINRGIGMINESKEMFCLSATKHAKLLSSHFINICKKRKFIIFAIY